MDIFGPADAPNSVTTRPADSRTFGPNDTWMKDCTDPDADDGTEINQDWFNGLLGSLRRLVRINGGLTAAPATPVVAENGLSDELLALATQHLMQRGQPIYAVDSGVKNALVGTLSPPPPEYKAGMAIRIKVAVTNDAAVTLNLNGLGLKNIIRQDGAALYPRDLIAGMIAELRYDGTAWQFLGTQTQVLTAPRTYYINPATGSDTANDGLSSGAPFQTVQKALNAAALFNFNGFNVTINCAAGNYAQFAAVPINGSGSVRIIGDTVTPANCTVNGLTAAAIDCGMPGYFCEGFKVVSSLSSPASPGVRSYASGNLTIKNFEFGACNIAHVLADIGGNIGIAGETDNPSNFIRISGGAPYHLWANSGGRITTYRPLLQITGSVTFSLFAFANFGSLLAVYQSITGAGFVIGQKFLAALNGIVATNGGGASYLPGTVAGSTQTGGQYV